METARGGIRTSIREIGEGLMHVRICDVCILCDCMCVVRYYMCVRACVQDNI